jgi:hypothetical protein
MEMVAVKAVIEGMWRSTTSTVVEVSFSHPRSI